VASTPAANAGRYPARIISGIVNAPVVTAFAIALPLTVPKRPLEITATLPAPPRVEPATASARSVKNWSRPPRAITPPNSTNRKMNVAETSVGMPNTPSVVIVWSSTKRVNDTPPWERKPGSHGPANAYAAKPSARITSAEPMCRRDASSRSSTKTTPTTRSRRYGSSTNAMRVTSRVWFRT
jgi:hypothetical protein